MARSYTFKQLMTVTGLFVIASVLGVKLLGFRLDGHESRETVYAAEPIDLDVLSPVQLDVDVDASIFEATKASVHMCSASAASLFLPGNASTRQARQWVSPSPPPQQKKKN